VLNSVLNLTLALALSVAAAEGAGSIGLGVSIHRMIIFHFAAFFADHDYLSAESVESRDSSSQFYYFVI